MKTAFRSATLIMVFVFALLLLSSNRGLMLPQDRDAIAMNKIAPWVLEHTAKGAQAEFLVIMNDQADLGRAETLKTKEEKGRFVRDALWNKAQASQGAIMQWLEERKIEYRSFYIVNMIWVKADLDVAKQLAARGDVARIEGNPEVRNKLPEPEVVANSKTTGRPDSPDAIEAGINHTRAPEVWAQGFTGANVVVGAADTGYLWDHAALKNQYRGWNGSVANHNFNWHDSVHTGGGSCGANSVAPCDDNGHGTHTAGTAVGSDGAANQIGMAPGAKWIGCRNMNVGAGTPASYMECFEFFLAPYPVGGTPAQGNPALAPDVTTNSWSCPTAEGCSAATLQAGVEAQRAAGILMVVAATNSGPSCSTVVDPPAIYDAAYSVGALTTGTDTIASFSSRGPVTVDGSNRVKPDIAAPGTSTRSSTRTTTTAYASLSGTSMATPHVAGAVALLWSAQPGLINKVSQTETILNNAAKHIPLSGVGCQIGMPNNVYGFGRLDIRSAVDQALRYADRPFDLDGDGKTDFPIYRPNDDGAGHSQWYILNSVTNVSSQQPFGLSTDLPVPGDYDGNGVSEIAVFRGSEGAWYISLGSAQNFYRVPFGANGDVPVPADYDGDGKTDIAVWRPSTGTWYISQSSDGGFRATQFGTSGDKVVPGDYDGDGKTDVAVFRPSTGVWYILKSLNGSVFGIAWGVSSDQLVQGYYDADSKMDIAVWRPASGTWYILKSTTNYTTSDAIPWGTSGDIPVQGDYEADGQYDVGVFRPSTGQWYVRRSSDGSTLATQWGQSGDRPALSAYVP